MLAARTPAPAVLQLEDDVTTEPEREESGPEEVSDPTTVAAAHSDPPTVAAPERSDSPAGGAPAHSDSSAGGAPGHSDPLAVAAPGRSGLGWRRWPALWLGVALVAALLIGCGGLATGFVVGRVTDGPGHGGGWNRGDRGGWDGRQGGQGRRDERSVPRQPRVPAPTAPASSVPVPSAT